MSDTNTNTNTTNANPGKFELIKNHETGFWELTTPNPKLTYILASPTEYWLNVVYRIGLSIARYDKVNEVVGSPVSTPSSIRDVGGIKQLIGGW